ncbi:MAG: hypothetical protein JSU86_09140 [Phycisphaerales bacterium]|nr:MAG: hypothetical protein JSU86_09140 [Phycisphaerales bacterium]
MTQFQQPPLSPGSPMGGPTGIPPGIHRPPPWSAAAISGFVLSLLGCLGITAILGLILGITGIATTRGGRRRGLGLAIAAIPISLVTGALSIVVGMGMLLAISAGALAERLPEVFEADSSTMDAAVDALREIGSDDFNATVSTEMVRGWLEQVAVKHGKLVEVIGPAPPGTTTSSDGKTFSVEAKFVNGRANITISFGLEDYRIKLHDIQVDGVSPRDLE